MVATDAKKNLHLKHASMAVELCTHTLEDDKIIRVHSFVVRRRIQSENQDTEPRAFAIQRKPPYQKSVFS